jgi:hypothetical protein
MEHRCGNSVKKSKIFSEKISGLSSTLVKTIEGFRPLGGSNSYQKVTIYGPSTQSGCFVKGGESRLLLSKLGGICIVLSLYGGFYEFPRPFFSFFPIMTGAESGESACRPIWGVIDPRDEDCLNLRLKLRDMVKNCPMKLCQALPFILAIIHQFILASGSSDLALMRVLGCGVLICGCIMAVRVQDLATFLGVSKSTIFKTLNKAKWQTGAISNDKLQEFLEGTKVVSPAILQQMQFRFFKGMASTREPDEIAEPDADPDMVILEEGADPIEIIRCLKAKLGARAAELKRANCEIAGLKGENTKLKAKLDAPKEERFTGRAQDDSQEVPRNYEPERTVRILHKLLDLAKGDPRGRRYDQEIYDVAALLYSINANCYRSAREIFPLPSPESIAVHFKAEVDQIKFCIETGNEEVTNAYLQHYRETHGIGQGRKIPCVLALDATSVTATGVGGKGKNGTESCFAFLVLPLDHNLPDLLIRSIRHETGRIDAEILAVLEHTLVILGANDFDCRFVATDGDAGTNVLHNTFFNMYVAMNGDLNSVVSALESNNRIRYWPVSDFFHLLKNARTRLGTGRLSLNADSETEIITGASVSEHLELKDIRIGTTLVDHSSLDLLKDDLALRAFTLQNLVALKEYGDYSACYYMLPYVCLNLALRNRFLPPGQRLDLIQIAFIAFFEQFKNYPETGQDAGIWENGGENCPRKTFWTKMMCVRACNLCVALYSAIRRNLFEPIDLALGRIGSHSVECFFGTTRSQLRGDTRWEKFLKAELKTVLIRRLMKKLNLQPYIRRFKNEAGITIGIPRYGNGQNGWTMGFASLRELIAVTWNTITGHNTAQAGHNTAQAGILNNMELLSEELGDKKKESKVCMSSRTSGCAIMSRLFSAGKREPKPVV